MTRIMTSLICILLLAAMALPAAWAEEPARKQGTYNDCLNDCYKQNNNTRCRGCCMDQAMQNGTFEAGMDAFGNCWKNTCNRIWNDGCVIKKCWPARSDMEANLEVSYNCHLKSY